MRWYKIEFFTHGMLPENRIKVVECVQTACG